MCCLKYHTHKPSSSLSPNFKNLAEILFSCCCHVEIDWKLELHMATHGHIRNGSTWPAVLDADGQPLRSGVEYYILPAATDTAGGLTLVNRNNGSICPLFVGQEPLAPVVSLGTSVIFTPRVTVRDNIIRETRDFTVAFTDVVTICAQSTAWMVGERNPEKGRRYILAEMEPRPSSNIWYFNIVKNGQGLYNFQWCPNCLTGVCPKPLCGDAGIVVENERRLLVLDGPAFPFVFRRAPEIISISQE
ncbi:unnamed protein product [Dovyalis caffra]|uniref:Uncharacterized protein n=1 Tax=Dovyalis caffra TaxID=77055 RepID=A0AAV1SQY3_9ROSI|nr:unnamed protein product [Dovyalis caffra]